MSQTPGGVQKVCAYKVCARFSAPTLEILLRAERGITDVHVYWDSLALLQGSFGPFGPKESEMSSQTGPDPLSRGGPKSPKRSRRRVKIDYFSTISMTLFRLRLGLFFRHFGPEVTPVAGQSFRNTYTYAYT